MASHWQTTIGDERLRVFRFCLLITTQFPSTCESTQAVGSAEKSHRRVIFRIVRDPAVEETNAFSIVAESQWDQRNSEELGVLDG